MKQARQSSSSLWRAEICWAALGLLTAVISYYLCDAALGMSDGLNVYPLVFWSVAAIVIAPVMATLGVLAQENTGWSLLAGLAAPLIVAYFRVAPGRTDLFAPALLPASLTGGLGAQRWRRGA